MEPNRGVAVEKGKEGYAGQRGGRRASPGHGRSARLRHSTATSALELLQQVDGVAAGCGFEVKIHVVLCSAWREIQRKLGSKRIFHISGGSQLKFVRLISWPIDASYAESLPRDQFANAFLYYTSKFKRRSPRRNLLSVRGKSASMRIRQLTSGQKMDRMNCRRSFLMFPSLQKKAGQWHMLYCYG